MASCWAGPPRRIRPVANLLAESCAFTFGICDAWSFRLAARPLISFYCCDDSLTGSPLVRPAPGRSAIGAPGKDAATASPRDEDHQTKRLMSEVCPGP